MATIALLMDDVKVRPKLHLGKFAAPTVGVLILLAIWELLARTVAAERHVIPTIPELISTMVSDGFYASASGVTLWEAARGYFWGNLVALAVAAGCLLLPPVKDFLIRLAMITYCTPTIAIAPLLIVLLTQDEAKVAMAALSVFFPTLLGALLGLEGGPKTALEFSYVSGASNWFSLTRIRLRAAVPEIAAALALAAPAAIVGAMIGEYLGGDNGLGVMMVQAQQSANVARVWAVAVVATGISTIFYLAINAWAKRMEYTATSTEFAVRTSGQLSGDKMRVGRTLLRVVVSFVAIIVIWYAALWISGMDDYIAKTPLDVLLYLTVGDEAAEHRALLFEGLKTTLGHALIGYTAGTVVAIVAAVAFLNSRLLEGMFMPVVMTLRAVPLVAMTPLLALVFGRGTATVAVLAGAVTFVPTLVLVLAALRSVPKPALDLMHVVSANWWQSLTWVRIMYAIPALAASARIAIPGSILGAVLVEMLVTGDGIGYTVAMSIGVSDYNALWSALALLSLATALIYVLLSWVETKLMSRITS